MRTAQKLLLAAVATLAVSPAFADNSWTYETDDGRTATPIQANRAGAACSASFNGPTYAPTWISCMRAQGYIVHMCTSGMWWHGMCESGFLQGLHN